jgi:hypothetical protein
MKSFFIAILSLIVVLPAFAQTDSTHEENISFGVGLSYSPFAVPGDDQGHFGTAGMTNFFVPMQFGPYIRFEPEFGLFFKNYQEQVPDSSGSTFLRTSDQQIVRAGFGLFYTKQPDKDFQYGLGARIGIISSEYEMHQAKATVQDSDIHYGIFYLGGALSVEYFVSKHFSFGGELQLIHYGFGAPLVTVGSNELSGYLSPDSPQQSVWSTNEVLSARFWF